MHFQEKTELEGLLDIAKAYLKKKRPFVLYRLPKDKVVKGIFQHTATDHIAVPFSGSGFVFAPFSSNNQTFWLRPDACFYARQQDNLDQTYPKHMLESDGREHMALVRKAIVAVNTGSFNKVVLSKPFKVATKVEPTTTFRKAIVRYDTAFCYLWYHPNTGIWLGASPEQLAITKERYFFTTALAGTLPHKGLEQPNWSPKEFEEQEMVTQYLKDLLGAYLVETKVADRQSVRAGNLWHLKTNISGRMKNGVALHEIIKAIHPTSAVCGLPKRASMEFIIRNEGYDRKHYTGYLGEVQGKDRDASIFVNLRCMQILGDGVRIFVGGGITKDSDPQKEWDELLNKSSTMLSLL